MNILLPDRVVLILRDQDGYIIDCFPGPFSYEKLQHALAIASTLLMNARPSLARVEIHPHEHVISSYTEKPLAVLTKEDMMAVQ